VVKKVEKNFLGTEVILDLEDVLEFASQNGCGKFVLAQRCFQEFLPFVERWFDRSHYWRHTMSLACQVPTRVSRCIPCKSGAGDIKT
jgi:hypothetical protein